MLETNLSFRDSLAKEVFMELMKSVSPNYLMNKLGAEQEISKMSYDFVDRFIEEKNKRKESL